MSDNVTDITVPILIDIRDTMRAQTERLGGELALLNHKVDNLNHKVDNLIEAAGAGRRDHEVRLTRVEARVAKLERRSPK